MKYHLRKKKNLEPYFCVAVCQATAIIKLMGNSTGMTSATIDVWHQSVLSKPLPAPAIRPEIAEIVKFAFQTFDSNCYRLPVGPFKLSTQPGIGSFMAAVTMVGLTMASGIPPHSSSSKCSASALVYV